MGYAPSSPPDDRGIPASGWGFGGRTGPVDYELHCADGCGYLGDHRFSCRPPRLRLLRRTVASSEPAPSPPASTSPAPAAVASTTEPLPKAAKTYHDGSLRDIDAIGNRKVGCDRGIGNWYSLEKQIEMGRGYAQQVESTTKLVTDPEITEYVNRIGQNLVRNSDAQVPFTIKVVDTDDINAFALPGGFFYVDSGLILAADNEAELAGVMAHEIAHVAACHLARENTRGQRCNWPPSR